MELHQLWMRLSRRCGISFLPIRSSYATAQYLKEHSKGGEAYVIGEQGIYDELNEVGIKCHGKEDADTNDLSSLSKLNPSVTSVVVGLDRNVNYLKLSRAAAYIRDQNCSFIATNTDPSDPTDDGLVVGAAGRNPIFFLSRLYGECSKCYLRQRA